MCTEIQSGIKSFPVSTQLVRCTFEKGARKRKQSVPDDTLTVNDESCSCITQTEHPSPNLVCFMSISFRVTEDRVLYKDNVNTKEERQFRSIAHRQFVLLNKGFLFVHGVRTDADDSQLVGTEVDFICTVM